MQEGRPTNAYTPSDEARNQARSPRHPIPASSFFKGEQLSEFR
jgi:hypothetical protein